MNIDFDLYSPEDEENNSEVPDSEHGADSSVIETDEIQGQMSSSSSSPSVAPDSVEYQGKVTEKPLNVSSDRELLPEYKRFSRLGVLVWFLRRNSLSLLIRVCIVCFFFWLLLCGGLVRCINWFTGSLVKIGDMQKSASSDVSEISSSDEVEISDSSENVDLIPDSSENITETPDVAEENKKDEIYLTLVMPEKAYLNTGDCLKVGDLINENSPLFKNVEDGKTLFVSSINFHEFCVLLSNGDVLRMRSSR